MSYSLYKRIKDWYEDKKNTSLCNNSKSRLRRLELLEQMHLHQKLELKKIDAMQTVHIRESGKEFRYEINKLNERFKATDAATQSVISMMENLMNHTKASQTSKPKQKKGTE